MREFATTRESGKACELCETPFVKAHGYPVVCLGCWTDLSKEEKKDHHKAVLEIKEAVKRPTDGGVMAEKPENGKTEQPEEHVETATHKCGALRYLHCAHCRNGRLAVRMTDHGLEVVCEGCSVKKVDVIVCTVTDIEKLKKAIPPGTCAICDDQAAGAAERKPSSEARG